MKKLIYCFMALFIIIGCGGSGGGGNTGTAPQITNVQLFKNDSEDYTQTLIFAIGDNANVNIFATDPDLDMNTLYYYEYLGPNFSTPYAGPYEMLLPSQSATDMVYWLIEDIPVTGPTGDWRLTLWITDEKGNESNEFSINYVITE